MFDPVPLDRMSVLSVGEILWDQIGQERHLGGAPFNFAYHCGALGARARILSRVGDDELGELALHRAVELGVPTVLIQTDRIHPTGVVDVTLGDKGDATFHIRPNAAWDYIAFPDNARRAADHADILYYGTLAQRSPISRATILAVLASVPASCLRVLDLNLRQPLPTLEVIRRSLELADILKLNAEELEQLRPILDLPTGEISAARELLYRYEITAVVVTQGAEGAQAVAADGTVVKAPGLAVPVKDTVGSGDAFTAALVVSLVSGAGLEESLQMANAAGAYVATQAGGCPPVDRAALTRLLRGEPLTV